MANTLEFECYTELRGSLSHATIFPLELMIDDDLDLYTALGLITQKEGLKFKVTLEEIK